MLVVLIFLYIFSRFSHLFLFFYRYVGHLKERTLKDQMLKDPTEVIRKAVLRMLPRNKLRDVSVIELLNLIFCFLVGFVI